MGSFQAFLGFPPQWATLFWLLAFEHLWQATLFAGVALLGVQLLRRAPARARYAVWLIALVKFLLPTALLLFAMRQAGIELPALFGSFLWFIALAPALPLGAEEAFSQVFLAWTALWLVVSLALLGGWNYRKLQFARAVRQEEPIQQGREVRLLAQACAQMQVGCRVPLVLSQRIGEPGVWGVRRPVIVLPSRIAKHLSDEELRAVILHELAHVVRRDNLLGNLTMVLCCLVWFHPLVWWIDRRLLAERERACDDLVLKVLGGSRAYAAGLLKVIKFRLGWNLSGVAGAAGSHLGRRIQRILAGRPNLSLKAWHRAVVGSLALALLLLSMTATQGLGPCPNEGISVTAKPAAVQPVAPISSPAEKCPDKAPPQLPAPSPDLAAEDLAL
ncbi:MAG: M56 family metallopeptidase [Acidobacteriota bacterium]